MLEVVRQEDATTEPTPVAASGQLPALVAVLYAIATG